MPRHLEFTVEGEPGQISLETFATVIRNSFDILTNLDSAIASHARGSLEWFVAEVSSGSLHISIEARSKLSNVDNAPKVVEAFVNGFMHIQRERANPPYFSDYDLRKAQSIARTLRKDGARAVRIRDVEQRTTARIELDMGNSGCYGKSRLIGLGGKRPMETVAWVTAISGYLATFAASHLFRINSETRVGDEKLAHVCHFVAALFPVPAALWSSKLGLPGWFLWGIIGGIALWALIYWGVYRFSPAASLRRALGVVVVVSVFSVVVYLAVLGWAMPT